MQDAQVGTGVFQHFVAQDIYVFHPFIFHEIREAFALHAGHVEDVGIGYGLFCKVGVLYVFDVMVAAIDFIFFRHLQFIGGDEMEGGVEVAHGHQQ